MKVKVTEQGLMIPKELLVGIQEFEIRKENHHIVLIPTDETDSIEQLGSNSMSQEKDATAPHPKRSLSDYLGLLKDSPTFQGDPVEIQRQLRNEWD